MLQSNYWIFWKPRRKTNTLDIKDNSFSNLAVYLDTHGEQLRKMVKYPLKLPAQIRGVSPNKRDGLTTSVSTWDLLVPKWKTSKHSSETTSKIWPQCSIQETKLGRRRVKRKGLEWLRLKKQWTCIWQPQYVCSVSFLFTLTKSSLKKVFSLGSCCIKKSYKSNVCRWNPQPWPGAELSGLESVCLAEWGLSISLWVSSLKGGEECAQAPPIPSGCLRALAHRPFSHWLN